MLTERQLEASLRVLAALKSPQPATIVTTWDEDMQRAYTGLHRMGYVRSRDEGHQRGGTFRWNTIETTPLGLSYLTSIQSARSKKVGSR